MSTQDRYSSSLLIGVPIIVVIKHIYIYIMYYMYIYIFIYYYIIYIYILYIYIYYPYFGGNPTINYIINRVYLSGVDFKENSVKASYPVHRSHPKSTNLGLELLGCWENPKLDC